MSYYNQVFERLVVTATLVAACTTTMGQANFGEEGYVLEYLPDDILATMESEDELWAEQIKTAAESNDGDAVLFYLLDVDRRRWSAQRITVAFLGGDAQLHRDIVTATKQITDNCAIEFDFGSDSNNGIYRAWSRDDKIHSADIRVSFDFARQYFSLVGNDSKNGNVGKDNAKYGGRPHQTSLSLGSFDSKRPDNWEGVIRHEFMHALGVLHEHQNPLGACESVFRWEDDGGYEKAKGRDKYGVQRPYVNNGIVYRPGIYTYLQGAPNFWSIPKIDSNLRTVGEYGDASSLDRRSNLLYRFESFFYVNPVGKSLEDNPCVPLGDGINLSDDDIAGLQLMYGKRRSDTRAISAELLKELKNVNLERLPEGLPKEFLLENK